MSSKIEWTPCTIQIEQYGRGSWGWKVWLEGEHDYHKSGNQVTKWGAIRRAKRYRKGVLVDE